MHDDFWKLINTEVARIDPPGQASVRPQLSVAFTAGWEPAGLVTWVQAQLTSAKGRVANPAGFVVAQLRGIPATPPPAQATPPAALPPACDDCLADNPAAAVSVRFRYQNDPTTGLLWVDPDTGLPVMCHCHPDSPDHTRQRETA
jgi:hypothetical protein